VVVEVVVEVVVIVIVVMEMEMPHCMYLVVFTNMYVAEVVGIDVLPNVHVIMQCQT
jgi:hypothetical protein